MNIKDNLIINGYTSEWTDELLSGNQNDGTLTPQSSTQHPNPNERKVIYYSLRYTPLIRDQLCVWNENTVVVISLFIHISCDNNLNHISCDNNVKFHSVVSEGLSRRERLTKWAKDHWIQSHGYLNLRILGFLVSSFIFTTINFTTFIPTSISHNFHPLTFIPITFNAPFLRIENQDSPFGDDIFWLYSTDKQDIHLIHLIL